MALLVKIMPDTTKVYFCGHFMHPDHTIVSLDVSIFEKHNILMLLKTISLDFSKNNCAMF